MDDAELRRTITARLNDLDPAAEYTLHHPTDYVAEFPQSGERFRGRDNMRAMRRAYPDPPTIRLRRLLGGGDLWIAETTADYGGRVYHGVSILELRDGTVVRETNYYAEPFPAPDWRAPWVEPPGPALPTASPTEAAPAPGADE